MSIFDSWGFEEAAKALDAARLPAGSIQNLKFYEGDHWQDGQAWLGSQLDTSRPDNIPAAQILSARDQAPASQQKHRCRDHTAPL